jgi:hypothetical protein
MTEGLLHFLQSTVGVYILAIAVFIKRNDLKWIMVLFIPIFLTYLYLYTIDPIMGGYGRYYYPSLPYFAFIALISVQRFFSDEPKIAGIKSHFKPVRILTIIIFGFFFAYKDLPQLGGEIETGVKKPIEPVHSAIQFATLSDKKLPGIYTNDYKYYYFEDLARVLRPLPAGVSIASSEYGYIGAAAPQIRIIDVIGLHDPDAAQIGFTGDHFYTAPPDMIFFPHFHYTYHIKEILDHPYFREHYLYYPGVFKFGFAINRDSKYFNLIYASFRREFERIYPGLRDTLYQAAAQP